MGAVDLVIQVESPGIRSPGSPTHRAGRAPGRRAQPRQAVPEAPQRSGRGGGRRRPHAQGSDRGDPLSPQPARRAVPADRRHVRPRRVGPRSARVRRAPQRQLRRPVRRCAAQRARPARGALPVRGVRRAAAPHRVGSRRRHDPGPVGRPAPGGHQRRHDPRPGSVPGSSSRTGPGSASSTRRWSTRAARARPSSSARRHGASRDITFERVIVTPAPGQPGKMPFWHGDGPGRPPGAGARRRGLRARAAGAARRRGVGAAANRSRPRRARRGQPGPVPRRAGRGHRCGPRRPHDRRRALPRRDWRLAGVRALPVRCPGPRPVGDGVAGPAGRAVGPRCRAHVERRRHRVAPAGVARPARPRRPGLRPGRDRRHRRRAAAEHLDVRVALSRVRWPRPAAPPTPPRPAHSAVAAAPTGRRPARRRGAVSPRSHCCWRRRANASTTCSTSRALRQVLGDLRTRRVRMVAVDTDRSSPFAQSLLFGWIAVYMYEGDAPLAERRAAALALDRDLLAELLGAEELRELIDADVLAELERELQRTTEGRRARDADELHDLVRVLGPLTYGELSARCVAGLDVAATVVALVEGASGDRGRHGRRRDPGRSGRGRCPVARCAGCGVAGRVAGGVHGAGRRSGRRPGRSLRGHPRSVPRRPRRRAARPGAGCGAVVRSIGWCRRDGSCAASSVPMVSPREWCDADVLRQLRRRSLAVLRREVEPVEPEALARFLPGWQGVGVPRRRGVDGLADVVSMLQGGAGAGVGARGRRLGRAHGGLFSRRPRCPVHRGRGGVGRCRVARCERRPDPSGVPRPGRPPAPADRRRGDRRPGAPLHPRAAGGPGCLVLARSGGGGGRSRAALRRCVRPGRPVGPRLGGRGDQRLVRSGAGARCRSPFGPGRPRSTRPPSAGSAGSGRRRGRGAGRSFPPSPSPDRRRPRRPTPVRCACSSATASSRERRRSARARPAGSPACIRC